jgi:hypothetical protein
MPINDFCHLYGLGNSVLKKFISNSYAHLCMLRFVQLSKLKEMNFLLREVAAMKDAVERWSIPALGRGFCDSCSCHSTTFISCFTVSTWTTDSIISEVPHMKKSSPPHRQM